MVTSYLAHTMKSLRQTIRINDYCGKRVAIDGYAWLFQCAAQVAFGKNNTSYIEAFLSLIDFLCGYGVEPVVVFGEKMIACSGLTDWHRQGTRDAGNCKGLNSLKQNKQEMATGHLKSAVHVTEGMIQRIIEELDFKKIEHLTAPGEIKSHLSYLTALNYVDTTLTGDEIASGACEILLRLGNTTEHKQRNLEDQESTVDLPMEKCVISSTHCAENFPEVPTVPATEVNAYDDYIAAAMSKFTLNDPPVEYSKASTPQEILFQQRDRAMTWLPAGSTETKMKATKFPYMAASDYISSDNKENIPPSLEATHRPPHFTDNKQPTRIRTCNKRRYEEEEEYTPLHPIKRPRLAFMR